MLFLFQLIKLKVINVYMYIVSNIINQKNEYMFVLFKIWHIMRVLNFFFYLVRILCT